MISSYVLEIILEIYFIWNLCSACCYRKIISNDLFKGFNVILQKTCHITISVTAWCLYGAYSMHQCTQIPVHVVGIEIITSFSKCNNINLLCLIAMTTVRAAAIINYSKLSDQSELGLLWWYCYIATIYCNVGINVCTVISLLPTTHVSVMFYFVQALVYIIMVLALKEQSCLGYSDMLTCVILGKSTSDTKKLTSRTISLNPLPVLSGERKLDTSLSCYQFQGIFVWCVCFHCKLWLYITVFNPCYRGWLLESLWTL